MKKLWYDNNQIWNLDGKNNNNANNPDSHKRFIKGYFVKKICVVMAVS